MTELERRLEARDRTIAALIRRAEVSSDAGLAFTGEQNLHLQQLVTKKTLELEAQRQALSTMVEELKSTQAKLLQAQKLEAIGSLAAGIAHEINTPTQYVSDNTYFLERSFAKLLGVVTECRALLEEAKAGPPSPETVARTSEVLRKANVDFLLKQVPRAIAQSLDGVRRVTSIVSAMKDFSHPSSGEKSPVDLHEAISSTITVATNEWKYVAEVETDFAADLPPVPCLRDEFNQVVLNLIVNAAHAVAVVTKDGADGKGKIRVETRRNGEHAEIVVRDSGCGIPESIRGRVFDPFFTTKPVGKGTGQGLAIAHSVIVDKHRGQIWLETAENAGTAFHILLPLVAPDSSHPPEATA